MSQRLAEPSGPIGIAIVGCGFVSDYYVSTLAPYTDLRLVGAYDRNPAQLARFAAAHTVHRYPSLQALCEDPAVAIVLNLTNPRSHAEVTEAALGAGRHVYSEKPLAMDFAARP